MKWEQFMVVMACLSLALIPALGQESSPSETASTTAPIVSSTSTESPTLNPSQNQAAGETPLTADQAQTSTQDRSRHHRGHHHRDSVVVVQPTPVFVEPRSDSVIFEQYPVPQSPYTSEISVSESSPPAVNYAYLGRDWGWALRRGSVSETQFVEFMRNYIVHARLQDYRTFYEAFVSAYGPYGDEVLGRAFKLAY
jgi:hypothetical protein